MTLPGVFAFGYNVKCNSMKSNVTHAIANVKVTNIWAISWENLFMPYENNKGADRPAHPRSLTVLSATLLFNAQIV